MFVQVDGLIGVLVPPVSPTYLALLACHQVCCDARICGPHELRELGPLVWSRSTAQVLVQELRERERGRTKQTLVAGLEDLKMRIALSEATAALVKLIAVTTTHLRHQIIQLLCSGVWRRQGAVDSAVGLQ